MKFKQDAPYMSCYVCIHPEGVGCDGLECYEVTDEAILELPYDEAPIKCGKYKPCRAGTCKHCATELEGDMQDHPYWFETVNGDCNYPICKNCYEAVSEVILNESLVCVC